MTDLLTILNVARHYGLKQALPIIQFTSLRNRLDREYQLDLQTQPTSLDVVPGRLREVKTISGGAYFRFERATLEAIFLAPDLVRLTWEPGQLPVACALAKTRLACYQSQAQPER